MPVQLRGLIDTLMEWIKRLSHVHFYVNILLLKNQINILDKNRMVNLYAFFAMISLLCKNIKKF